MLETLGHTFHKIIPFLPIRSRLKLLDIHFILVLETLGHTLIIHLIHLLYYNVLESQDQSHVAPALSTPRLYKPVNKLVN